MEGIVYYSNQRSKNNKSKLKLLTILFMLIVIVAYYFSDNSQTSAKPQTNLIVIKEPETKEIVITIPVNIEISTNEAKPKKPEILENLDEIIQIH